MLHGTQRWWTHWFCVCFSVDSWQKPKDPQIEPMADDVITHSSKGLVYICDVCRIMEQNLPEAELED